MTIEFGASLSLAAARPAGCPRATSARRSGTATITVLEAPPIPRIGVGEATIPNLQTAFFDFLGIPEDDLDARVQRGPQGRQSSSSTGAPPAPRGDAPRRRRPSRTHFYHLFGVLPTHDQIPLSHYWYQDYVAGRTDGTL